MNTTDSTNGSLAHWDKPTWPNHQKQVQAIECNHYFSPFLPLGILRISGLDAERFLQGQLTNDIRLVNAHTAQFSAHCDVKGRVQANFLIWQQDNDYYLAVSHDLLEATQKNLNQYVLRDKVNLIDQSGCCRLMAIGSPIAEQFFNTAPFMQQHFQTTIVNDLTIIALPNHTTFVVTPTASLQLLIDTLSQLATPINENLWQLANIRSGVVWINQYTTQTFIPQMMGMDRLNAISFNKGCYIGQEVVTRTHYLGQIKRHLYHIVSNQELVSGEILAFKNGEIAGQVATACAVAHEQYEALVVMKNTAWGNQDTLRLNHATILKQQASFYEGTLG